MTAHLPDGVDGELIVGMPTQDPYRRTVSAVMTDDDNTLDMHYFVFDDFMLPGGFQDRFKQIESFGNHCESVVIVPHVKARTPEELLAMEHECLEQGYEGVMIRSLNGPYKFGRSTVKEGYLLKLKRFKDAEAIVIGTYEQMHNANEAETNKLGRTERSTAKAGMVPTGMLGGFHVKDVKTGVEFDVSSSTIPVIERPALWRQRKSLDGRILIYKYFPTGSKDRPRFPIFKGWRSKDDI
jgi:DNA ligase-1